MSREGPGASFLASGGVESREGVFFVAAIAEKSVDSAGARVSYAPDDGGMAACGRSVISCFVSSQGLGN